MKIEMDAFKLKIGRKSDGSITLRNELCIATLKMKGGDFVFHFYLLQEVDEYEKHDLFVIQSFLNKIDMSSSLMTGKNKLDSLDELWDEYFVYLLTQPTPHSLEE